jgi:hypothetical protein
MHSNVGIRYSNVNKQSEEKEKGGCEHDPNNNNNNNYNNNNNNSFHLLPKSMTLTAFRFKFLQQFRHQFLGFLSLLCGYISRQYFFRVTLEQINCSLTSFCLEMLRRSPN